MVCICVHVSLYSQGPHKDIMVNDGLYIQHWSHKVRTGAEKFESPNIFTVPLLCLDIIRYTGA